MNHQTPAPERPGERRSQELGNTTSLKRRKIRKGTFSCWECKHRKRRCERDSITSICRSCQQHSVPCMNQDMQIQDPEITQPCIRDSTELAQRVEKVEALVNQLIQGNQMRVRRVIENKNSPTLRSVSHERLSRGRSLSGYLFSILPRHAISVTILGSTKQFSLPLQISKEDKRANSTIVDNSTCSDLQSTAHPLLLARRLIQLALCLKQFNPPSSKHLEFHLNSSIGEASWRYHEIAARLVLSQDVMVKSLDGIETLILQSRYHMTLGDTHRAWAIQLRAIDTARSLNIRRMGQLCGGRARQLWFLLVYSDRFMALNLGIQCVITEEGPSWDTLLQDTTPSQRLEGLHVAVSERIIARNIQMREISNYPNEPESFNCDLQPCDHYKETRDIDNQLKKATKLLPASWWLVSFCESTDTDLDSLERTRKLLIQMHQYYLTTLLHQPYLVQMLAQPCNLQQSAQIPGNQTYSKLTVVSSSREVLLRYLAIRELHQSPTYRLVDEKMYISAINLLLAHLHGHREGHANFLDHQRPQDLGLIDKCMSSMEKIATLNEDSGGLGLLQRLKDLMNIESFAAERSLYYTWFDQSARVDRQSQENVETSSLLISIPYFGSIHITDLTPALPEELVTHTGDQSATSNIQDPEQFLNDAGQFLGELFVQDKSREEDENQWFDKWLSTSINNERGTN